MFAVSPATAATSAHLENTSGFHHELKLRIKTQSGFTLQVQKLVHSDFQYSNGKRFAL